MAKRPRQDSLSSYSQQANTFLSASELPSSGHTPKYASIDESPEPTATPIQCLLPPHAPVNFSSYDDYESHYQQAHTNRCIDCQRNFPSGHLLDLHIAENHDPILASLREAGEKSYHCFVEGCEKACLDWKKRRRHLIDKHGFPKNYDFLVVDSGIDGKSSLLRPGVDADGHRRSSREGGERRCSERGPNVDADRPIVNGAGDHQNLPESCIELPTTSEKGKMHPDDWMANGKQTEFEDLAQSMSSLKMVPRSIKFGQGRSRAGFAKK